MIECPNCGGKAKVIDSRPVEMNVFRTRLCVKCSCKFYTEETPIEMEEAREYMKELKRRFRRSKK